MSDEMDETSWGFDIDPPDNFDPMPDTNELDQLEFELPVSEEFPPDEMQERLEMPTTSISTVDENGNDVTFLMDPVTEPGVEPVWSETDEMVGWTSGSSFGTVDSEGGQLQTSTKEDDADARDWGGA